MAFYILYSYFHITITSCYSSFVTDLNFLKIALDLLIETETYHNFRNIEVGTDKFSFSEKIKHLRMQEVFQQKNFNAIGLIGCPNLLNNFICIWAQ